MPRAVWYSCLTWPGQGDCHLQFPLEMAQLCQGLPVLIESGVRAAASCSRWTRKAPTAPEQEGSPPGGSLANRPPTGVALQSLRCCWAKSRRIDGAKGALESRLHQSRPALTFTRWLNKQFASSEPKFLTCLLNNCKVEDFKIYIYIPRFIVQKFYGCKSHSFLLVLSLSSLLSVISTFHPLLCQCSELPSLGFRFYTPHQNRTLMSPSCFCN